MAMARVIAPLRTVRLRQFCSRSAASCGIVEPSDRLPPATALRRQQRQLLAQHCLPPLPQPGLPVAV